MNKRTLQEIFDAVIDAELYPANSNPDSSYFMCRSIVSARRLGIINKEEADRVTKSIDTYLNKLGPGVGTLVGAWINVGITKEEFGACKPKLLACYRDWTNRPYAHRALKKNK